jgi:hypothetical protein
MSIKNFYSGSYGLRGNPYGIRVRVWSDAGAGAPVCIPTRERGNENEKGRAGYAGASPIPAALLRFPRSGLETHAICIPTQERGSEKSLSPLNNNT